MIDLIITGVFILLASLGGIFIKDVRGLSIFVGLITTATFLTSFLLNMPIITLGVLGLVTSIVKISTVRRKEKVRGIRTYKSSRRLSRLEESVRSIPENILDVIPAGSKRAVHPKLLQLISVINEAYSKGYIIEEPDWFRAIRIYLASVGPEFKAGKIKIISEYEVVEL